MSSDRRASRLAIAVVCGLLLGVLAPVVAPGGAGAAPSDDLASKRAQAADLESRIESNGVKISQLDEDYNQAQLELDQARSQIAAAQNDLAVAQARSDRLRAALNQRAAALYMGAGARSPLPQLDATDVREAGTVERYTAAAAADDRRLVDDLGVASEDLDARLGDLRHARAAAQAQAEAITAARSEVEAAQAEQERLLGQVQGDIARLVREEAARRAAAAERQARAELARRQAAEAAARRVAATPSGASTPAESSTPSYTPPADVPAASGGAATAIAFARAQLGKPYRYAATGPSSYDCSGLTMAAWAAAGVSLPHSSRAQYAVLPHIPMDALAPGDLVFYGSPIHHVGMYLGGGQYIHAPQTGDVVKIASVYRSDFVGAGRPG